MGKKDDNIFAGEPEDQPVSEVFAKQPKTNPGSQDIFSGNENFHRGINRGIARSAGPWWKRRAKDSSNAGFPLMQTFIIVNLLAVTALVAYLLIKPPAVNVTAPEPGDFQGTTPGTSTQEPVETDQKIDTELLDQAVSWKTAEMLFDTEDYKSAFYVFSKLGDNLPQNIPGNDVLRDYLYFKMALCMQKTSEQTDIARFFTTALQSPSPVVRGLANYRLAFIENGNRQYLAARERAYRTIALLKAFEETFPPTIESDCYFLAAEALTRYILELNNDTDALPGQLWADTMSIVSIPLMDQDDLRKLLQTGMGKLTGEAMRPRIEKQDHLNVGMRWSAVSMDASLGELLGRFASAARMNLVWNDPDQGIKDKSVSIFMPSSSEQVIAEVAAASTGMIARLDGQDIDVHNPNKYDDLEAYKQLLTQEAIAVWRRFLIRYRGDHRIPNAHFALGLLNDYAEQTHTSLGEYKLVAGNYPNNPLAPFALFNSSILRTNLRQYDDARRDLTEIIIQYPDCKVVGQASLYHAEATMKSELYDDAIKSFARVYNLELNEQSQRDAAYGLGQCYFRTKNFAEARKWFITAIDLTDNTGDQRLHNSYFMLGKSCIELKKFQEASAALAKAINDDASREEFVNVLLQMAKAEALQENYVTALNILNNVPVEKLSQEDACAVLRAEVEIFRQIDLVDVAMTLLRRKIEFIADSQLRAQLIYELAVCYFQGGDYRIARKEAADALIDLPAGKLAYEAYLLLARTSIKLGDYEQARDTCRKLLAHKIEDESVRQQALALLGETYAKMQMYDQAAMVYAGSQNMTGMKLK